MAPLPATPLAVLEGRRGGVPGCRPPATAVGSRHRSRRPTGCRGRRAALPAGCAHALGRHLSRLAGPTLLRLLMGADLDLETSLCIATTTAEATIALGTATASARRLTSRRALRSRTRAPGHRCYPHANSTAVPVEKRSAATAASLLGPRPRSMTSARSRPTTSARPRPSTSGRRLRLRRRLRPTLSAARPRLDCLCVATVVLGSTTGKALPATNATDMGSGLGRSEVELICFRRRGWSRRGTTLRGRTRGRQNSTLGCGTSTWT